MEKTTKNEQLQKAIEKIGLKLVQKEKAQRYSFAKFGDKIEIPNLIHLQIDSFNEFINEGIGEVLKAASPITDYTGNLILEFFGYRLEDETKYNFEETKTRNLTYGKKLYVNVRLINKESGEIKEQEISLGEIPIISDSGEFLVNGKERVIVTQVLKAPGCYFEPATKPNKNTLQKLYKATITPATGTWLEFETEAAGTIFSRVDRTRKISSTVVLRALGLENAEDIIKIFGEEDLIIKTLAKDPITTQDEALLEIYKKLKPGELPTVDAARNTFNSLFFDAKRYNLSMVGRFKYNQKLSLARRINRRVLAENVVDCETGELLFEKGHKLEYDEALKIQNSGINRVVIKHDGKELVVLGNGVVDIKEYIGEELKEKLGFEEDVNYLELMEILDNTKKSDLEDVLKANKDKLITDHVTKEDILAAFNYLINLHHGMYKIDNVDHLGNRRIRRVGEMLQNEFRKGIDKLEKTIKERMTTNDIDTVTPQTLINPKPVTGAITKFFNTSELSQYMDQINGIGELANKRRISSSGPGGLTRERAGFEVRDIHYTHYGRICPIESPEGQNIGLVLSFAIFARVNKYGFIETPYRKIDKETGIVTDEIVYMSADMEDNFMVCQAIEPLTKDGKLKNERVVVRYLDELKEVEAKEVDYMEISPKQLVSVSTAMIPFVGNDAANRALMGANMQRQGVPLIKTDSPMVGTGMEYRVAKDSEVVVNAKEAGIVEKVTANYIVINEGENKKKKYSLRKMRKTNTGTCINEIPIVKEGEKITKGQIIADSMGTDNGEMAVGKNVVIAFLNWEGYNFEDGVLINEKLIKDDVYTSIHIEEYECECRDTKLRT